MKTKFTLYLVLFLTIISQTSCSALLTNDFAVDHKVIGLAETEVNNLRMRTGVIDSYDPRAAMAYQAGQKIYNTITFYLQDKGKEKVLQNFRYEIVILNDPKVDCYGLGGGKIVIHAGLLDHISSEDEIAYIIAHELAHEIERHSYKKLKSSFLSEVGSTIINGVVDPENESKELYLSAFGVSSSAFGAIKFSNKEELDADELALLWVAKTLYNPKAAVAVISKLEALSKSGFKVTFIEVHPTDTGLQKRIDELAEKYFQEYFLPSIK